jgi:hypothetical protein
VSPPPRRSGGTQPTIPFTAVVRPTTASADSNTLRIDKSEPPRESIENATPVLSASLQLPSRDPSPSASSQSSSSSTSSRKRKRANTEAEMVANMPKRDSWIYKHMPDVDKNTVYWKTQRDGSRIICWTCKYCIINGWAISGGTRSAAQHLIKYQKLDIGTERQQNRVINEQDRVDVAIANLSNNSLRKRRIAGATGNGNSINPKVLEYLWI